MYQPLFDFLNQSHGLTLLHSEMEDLLNHILGGVVRAENRYTVERLAKKPKKAIQYVVFDNITKQTVSFLYLDKTHAELEALKMNYHHGTETKNP